MISWNQRKIASDFEKWVKTPLYDDVDYYYDDDDELIDIEYSINRGMFIYQFVRLYLEPWLNKRNYTFGKNLRNIPSKMLHWWFFQNNPLM